MSHDATHFDVCKETMDSLTPKERSHVMSLVRAKNTKPEIAIRRLVSALGYNFRLHAKALPGCPDLVFPRLKKAIFVHGCFWHQHWCKNGNRLPKSRIRFWRTKLEGNKLRDKRNRRMLRRLGWKVLIVWECQITPTRLLLLTERIMQHLKEREISTKK